MGQTAAAILLAVLSFASAVGQAPSDSNTLDPGNHGEAGTVCVLPNSTDPPTRFSRGGEYNLATLTVSIDKRPPIPWPHKRPVKMESLAINERHLLVLKSDGKRIQSLWFQFSEYKDSTLCLCFDSYQGVQLGDRHNALWCKAAMKSCGV